MSDLNERSHRRYNPLSGDWVLVSPHRTDRPWLGERETASHETVPAYDPTCYLCPGNVRANGERNPQYESSFVFRNDYAALSPPSAGAPVYDDNALFVAQPVDGDCRVVCFSPRHDLHLSALSPAQVTAVIDCWAGQYGELAALPYVDAITIFENRGAMMGASNPHPHGQIWAESSIPNELAKETASLLEHQQAHGACLLCNYVELEIARDERIVFANDAIVAVVPFWATWPFETLLLPRGHYATLLNLVEREALAEAMRDLVSRYDRLFGVPFPYSMGVHQAPCDGGPHGEWHLHAHYYPPLLRSADVRKFMVGYEMLAQPQRDLTPELAAQRLRQVS